MSGVSQTTARDVELQDPMDSLWFKFVLALLATWRVTHLISREDGPGDVLVKLRVRAGTGVLGQVMDCFNCLSLWIAAPFAFLVGRSALEIAALVACALRRGMSARAHRTRTGNDSRVAGHSRR